MPSIVDMLAMLAPKQPILPSEPEPPPLPTLEEIMAGVEARGAASPTGQLLAALRASNAAGQPGMSMGAYGQLPVEAQSQVSRWSSGFGPEIDALGELIQQRGAAIGTGGQVVPQGGNYPGLRTMPMGLGAASPTPSGPSPADMEARTFAAMAGMRGMGYVPQDEPGAMMGNDGRPMTGTAGIKNDGAWWTKSGESIPPEAVEKNRKNIAAMESRRHVNKDADGDGVPDWRQGLTQRGKEKSLARHQRMGTSTLPEMLGVLSGVTSDPAMMAGAMFGPQGYSAATDAQTQRMNMANQNALNNDPMRQYLAYISAGGQLSPQDWIKQIKGFGMQSPVNATGPDYNKYFDVAPDAKSALDLIPEDVITANPEGFIQALKDRYGEDAPADLFSYNPMIGGSTWQKIQRIKGKLYPGSVSPAPDLSGIAPIAGATPW